MPSGILKGNKVEEIVEDILNKIADLYFLGEIMLVGIDVELLYTSIPHK